MTAKDYIIFELVKLLFEKGYTKYPLSYDGDYWFCYLQMVVKWLREIHHIDICVCREIDEYGKCFNGYIAVVYQDGCYKITIRSAEDDLAYEEATNKAIKYGLTLI